MFQRVVFLYLIHWINMWLGMINYIYIRDKKNRGQVQSIDEQVYFNNKQSQKYYQ